MEDTIMKIYTTLIATLLVIGLMAPTVSTQTDRKIDYVQMVEDIEIMCRIIDKNMKDVFKSEYYYRTGSFRRQGCQGFYLKNYGVIFTLEVQFPVTQKEIPVAPKKKQKADLWQELEREVRHLPHPVDAPPVRTQNKKYDSKKIDKLKERLTHIIGEYSQRIDQLDANEKISIVVTSRSEQLSDLSSNHVLATMTFRLHQEPLIKVKDEVAIVKPRVITRTSQGFGGGKVTRLPRDDTLLKELEAAREKLNTLLKKHDKLRSFPSTTMILTFNESTLRDANGSDWKQILASADIVQY
jgi:hypothetical protein